MSRNAINALPLAMTSKAHEKRCLIQGQRNSRAFAREFESVRKGRVLATKATHALLANIDSSMRGAKCR
jgi:hypothetical protein